MNKTIDIKEALTFGWNTLRANFVFFIKIIIILMILGSVPAYALSQIMVKVGPALALPLQLLNIVWQSLLGMGVLTICLKLEDGQTPQISDLWVNLPRTLDYIVVKFAVGIIVMVGLILLIIPGIIWGLQFYLASYFIVDRSAGFVDALKGSSAITHGAKWNLAVFGAVMLVVNIAGVVCLGVGVLITLPITLLASVHVYRKLLAATTAAA